MVVYRCQFCPLTDFFLCSPLHRFQIRIQTTTNLTRQVLLTVRPSDIATTTFTANIGARSQVFNLFPAGRLPNVTFVPQTDRGFVLLLQPTTGERFQVSAGSYRLVLALTMAEIGADIEWQISTAASGYVRVELVDLDRPEPLDADWFTSEAATGLGQDARGKWVVRIRGSTKPLANAMSFAAIRVSFVYVAGQGSSSSSGVARRSAAPVTVVASPSAGVSVTYSLG
jgi:hypothetical protein